jgi:1-acyl-sn-glycerol-3-phosphate acyltransferase
VRLPPRAVRRLLRDPLWPLIAALLAAVFLLVAVAGGLAWPVTRRARAARLGLLAAYYLALNVTLLVGCAALWAAHPVAGRRDGEQWQRAHTALLRAVLGRLRRAAGPLLGFRVLLEEPPAADRLDSGPLLLLARHAGPGDSFTLVDLLLSRYHRTPRIVLKQSLQWDPGLDVILNRLGACFLPRAGGHAALTLRLADLARDLRAGDAMLIFPEGRNWTPRRYQRAIARLRRRAYRAGAASRRAAVDRQAAADAEQNPNVLPPQPGGVLATLAALPDLGIVVIAHTGLDELVTPAQVWRALPLHERPMTIRWWYVPPGTVPSDPAAQYQWLRVQWALVDSWIGARKAQSGLAGAAPGPAPAELAAVPAEPAAAAMPDPVATGVPDPVATGVPDPVAGDEPSPDGDPLLDTPG